jgi:hypothetical protein
VLLHPLPFTPSHSHLSFTDTPEMEDVLWKYEPSLRAIFSIITNAAKRGAEATSSASAQLLSIEEWSDFLDCLGLITSDLTLRDASLAFAWSRMAVVNNTTSKGQCREANLPFEGFLEALCRVAVMKALPTDEEIARRGHAHAGEYMAWIRSREDLKTTFMAERNVEWGEEYTLQPVPRAVDHLISMIIYTIEAQIGGDNGKLTGPEVIRWAKGQNLKMAPSAGRSSGK